MATGPLAVKSFSFFLGKWGGMAELSMNETTTFRWSFEEDVAHYAAAGIPAIGVWRQNSPIAVRPAAWSCSRRAA